jgi:flagellar biosynthetic protein FliR
MNFDASEILNWAPAFVLVLARVGAAMALLPGVGETDTPAIVRIGLALAITVLILPGVQPMVPPLPEASLDLALMIGAEVVTGLSFGWTARVVVLALPVAGQIVGYLIGLSSVLQPDSELGSQTGALSKLFAVAAPLVVLTSGLYTLPLIAMSGLFRLIPPGHMLPLGDSATLAIQAVGIELGLAVQLASPFIVLGVAWQLAMGLTARIVSRMQIYFVSMPGQILVGLTLLALTSSAIVLAWRNAVVAFMTTLPGNGY